MWKVHHDAKVREWNESTVRRKLRKGKLTGIELVLEPGSEDWRPLHSTPLYAQVVPHVGDSEQAALGRVSGSFFSHAASFAIVITGFTIATGTVPLWAAWWGIGLAFHGLKTFKDLRKAKIQQGSVPSAAAHTATVAMLADSEVISAIDELTTAGWSGDAEALRATATELSRRRHLVDDSANDAARQALMAEKEQVQNDREHADPATQVLLDDQRDAIDARIAFLDNVRQLSVRLRAQERTFLHQIESLRLGQLQSSDTSTTTDLEASVTRLRRELDAESEVTDALARARQAQRQ